MIIRCYGARGSIPVSGKEFVKYGGDTTCLEIRSKNDEIIIVDAGSGMRRLGIKLLNEDRYEYSLLFTHSHLDHIFGFPFFRPIYKEKTKINLMGCPTTQGNLMKLLSRAMSPPLFPVRFEELKAEISYAGDCPIIFQIDSIEIVPINLSHPNMGYGYKFVEDGKKFVFITDNELGFRHRGGREFDEYIEFAKDADILIHDAEYTPEEYKDTKTWGHSTYVEALNLAIEAQVKRFGLFHHNQNRSDAEIDSIVEECRKTIETNKKNIECFAISQEHELTL